MTVVMERPGDYVRVPHGDMPPVRQFTVVVDRMPDEAQVRALGPLALVLWDPGVATVRVRFDWPARSVAEAVADAVRWLDRSGLRALRVDADDWVTVADVAQRIGRSRETVRLWSIGRLGPAGFPPPLNPGRDTTFYSWVEVQEWLRARMGLDPPYEDPTLAAANLALQVRALLPRVPQGRVLADLVCS
jgi:hypothetical protein